jgi:hypothetical protein
MDGIWASALTPTVEVTYLNPSLPDDPPLRLNYDTTV